MPSLNDSLTLRINEIERRYREGHRDEASRPLSPSDFNFLVAELRRQMVVIRTLNGRLGEITEHLDKAYAATMRRGAPPGDLARGPLR
jgi:hypothetical protein